MVNVMKKRLVSSVCLLLAVALVLGFYGTQTKAAGSEQSGAVKIASNSKSALIDTKDAVLLLVDNQSGLFQTVKDVDATTLRKNVVALAKMAKLAGIPVVYTASVPDGPNGPIIPEIKEILPDAVYVPRNGEVNAWDSPNVVKAVEATGRKTLIIAGTWASVCMTFPTLDALAAGYKVYDVIDASGTVSTMASDVTVQRVVQAGAVPIDTVAMIAEVQRTWNRSDAGEFAALYADLVPNYKLLMESYAGAQSAVKK